ncbi:MAG TPA: iron ABC transporter permease [Bacteroidales bacterium]|jgi:iron complex transport system permease protein|nr:iron ABC transporter permease [Bacteroidales bacterium]HQB36822.1 iron ABC transporter permease [Bacteroidales bacterium]
MHTAKGVLTAQHGRRIYILAILTLFLFVLLFLDIFLGSVTIAPSEVINAFFGNCDSNIATIVLKFRLPKAITAILVGMALSMSGLQMQTFFRNPMAGPYVLGVSSGASLGVAIVIMGFYSGIAPADLMTLGNWVLTLAAWLGAGAVMILIMAISVRIKDVMTILIIGIMLASGLSAVVSILQYFSNETMLKAYVVWTMGSLGNLSSGQLKVLAITVITGIILSIFLIKVLNALQMGENYASSVGVNIRLARVIVFACSCILAGSVTAFCGPIGFIGIAIPHIVRNLFRTSDHKILVPGSIITGGVVMLLCDIISQLPGSDRVLPVNSVTALVGIPVVVWIVIRNKKISGISDE